MRILVAEDERITRRSLQRQLEKWGHDVVVAEDGAIAWAQFQQQPFDIVVTDWEMPRMDGRQLIEHIRDNDEASYAYLIMLTGRSETVDLVSGMEAGADDFLTKPFDRNELRVRVRAGERIIQLERRLAAQNIALSKANTRMKSDLDAAAELQRNLLPKDLPNDLGATFAWHYQPCEELAGDILNVVPLGGHKVAMYLLDVTGHGVPSALLSVTLSQLLTNRDPSSSILVTQELENDAHAIRPPAAVAEHLNRQFPMQAQGGRFFTMTYAVLDTETGALRWANAGHPPPILVHRGEAPKLLTGGSPPIGVLEGLQFEEANLQLNPSDRVYFYSDGITEACNEQREMLQIEGLMQFVAHSQARPLDDAVAHCIEELKRWSGPIPLVDDISLLAFEYQTPGSAESCAMPSAQRSQNERPDPQA